MLKKRGESRELLRPLVSPYVEAHFAKERGRRWMPVTAAISGFFAAPYLAALTAFAERDIEDDGEKFGLRKILSSWNTMMQMIWQMSWYGLRNSKESDEEWQEFIDEQVEHAIHHIWNAWLILLDRAVDQNVVVLNEETMLPALSLFPNKDLYETIKETIDKGYYGIGWTEFVAILKEAKKRIPEKILPDDIMELFARQGIAVVGE